MSKRTLQFDGPDEPQGPTPTDYLQFMNKKGFSLHQSLNNMLKRWDLGDAGWPVEIGLSFQCSEFNITQDELFAAIRSNSRLTQRLRGYPESGFR